MEKEYLSKIIADLKLGKFKRISKEMISESDLLSIADELKKIIMMLVY